MNSYTIYIEHARYVERLLRRFGVPKNDIPDATQEVFERVHRRLHDFEGRSKIETWIHAVCWRVAAEYRRSRRAPAERESGVQFDSNVEPASFEQLRASVLALDYCDRELLVLHELSELSISELARITGSARTTIRRRLEKARRLVALGMDAPPLVGNPSRTHALDYPSAYGIDDERILASISGLCAAHEYFAPNFAISPCGTALIAIWHAPPDIGTFEVLARILLGMADRATNGFTYLCVVDPASSIPDADGRALSTWLIRETAQRCRAAAFASTSPEIWPMIPALANTWTFISGRNFNFRGFTEPQAALAWIAYHTHDTAVSKLVAHYRYMRTRMHVRTTNYDEWASNSSPRGPAATTLT